MSFERPTYFSETGRVNGKKKSAQPTSKTLSTSCGLKLKKKLNTRPHPQGSVLPLHPVSGPCSWEAADYSDPASYTTALSPEDVAELVSAIEAAERRLEGKGGGGRIERAVASRDDFPLPTLGPKLVALAEEAKNGRGFVLIRGFPVERLTRQQAVIGYWGFGLYW